MYRVSSSRTTASFCPSQPLTAWISKTKSTTALSQRVSHSTKNTFSILLLYFMQYYFIFQYVDPILCLLEKHNALQSSFSPSLSPQLFRNIRGVWSKKYFTDHRTANTIHLSAAKKENVSDLLFLWATYSKGKFSRDCLINLAIAFICISLK